MTLEELIYAARDRAADNSAHELAATDERLTLYLNEAEREACWRASLLVAASFPEAVTAGADEVDGAELTRVNIDKGVQKYDLDAHVLFIRRVQLGASPTPLAAVSSTDLDHANTTWSYQSGVPSHFVTGLSGPDTPLLWLYPIPNADDVAYLTVAHLPLFDMAAFDSTPEIPDRWHLHLIDWALYRAYGEFEGEKENAALHLANFTATFGERAANIEKEAQRLRQMANAMPWLNGVY